MSEAVGVVGAGAWGTALANMLASDGRKVTLWAREPELVEEINGNRSNSIYLPSAMIAETVSATGDLDAAMAHRTVLLVTPAQHLRATISDASRKPRDIVLCSKGIEAGSELLMHEVAAEVATGSEIAVLSGPTFAHEVAAGLPTAVTLACGGGQAQWDRLAPAIARPAFRPYYTDDLTGAEIGGSVKNVLAIACGVVDGLQLGQNARAALISRGYAEMQRFGEALGAQRSTLAGLCGLGDLVLTCSSTSSRNFSLGKALGQGSSLDDIMAERTSVAEGAHTAPVLATMARSRGVSMPIVEAVERLLQGETAKAIVQELLARPLTAEGEDA